MSRESEDLRPRAVIGLGNPGKHYTDTKHNAGFSVLDSLADSLPGKNEYLQGFNGLFYKARVKGRIVFFLKPLTFMNLSGNSVFTLCKKEKIYPEEIIVVYDDMDLPLGRIRIRKNGGSAGHNGVESIINRLDSNKFARLRIGIGRVSSEGMINHVLSEFSIEEKEIFNKVVNLSVAAIKLSLHRGIQTAMNKYNSQIINKTVQTTN
jgi:peptidyl-tRNA hydrolase, PTH1 family